MNFTNYKTEDIVTPIKVPWLVHYLYRTGYAGEKNLELQQGFTRGFDIGYRGPMDRKDLSRNIPLRIGTPIEMWNKIMKEVSMGRYAGPFYNGPPGEFYVQSPLGLVPKAGNRTRLIFHLSFDFGPKEHQKSINHFIPEEECTVKYKDLDYAVKTCIHLKKEIFRDLQRRYEQLAKLGIFVNDEETDFGGIYLAKTDIKMAFRLVPVLPRQRFLLTMCCTHPVTRKTAFFLEKNLPFGLSKSCAIFQFFSDALSHIIETLTGRHFMVTAYLDDYLFIEKTEIACNDMVSMFLELCEKIGCPIAFDKTEWATQCIVFLGMLLDGNRFVISIPEEKRNKALNIINWTIDKRKVTIHHVQRLMGILNFLNRVVVPGRAFTCGMYSKLKLLDSQGKPLKQHHHIWLGKQFIQDCRVWKMFLEEITISQMSRPFIDIDAFEYAHVLNFYTDASLSKKFGGLGGVFNDNWIA